MFSYRKYLFQVPGTCGNKDEIKNTLRMSKEISQPRSNYLSLTFYSPTNKITLTANKNMEFYILAKQIYNLESLDELRFLLDGTRIQIHLTLAEKYIQDNDVIEIVQEMSGGKGPSDENILKMLENCKSDSEDSEEDSDADQFEKSKEGAERADQNIHNVSRPPGLQLRRQR